MHTHRLTLGTNVSIHPSWRSGGIGVASGRILFLANGEPPTAGHADADDAATTAPRMTKQLNLIGTI